MLSNVNERSTKCSLVFKQGTVFLLSLLCCRYIVASLTDLARGLSYSVQIKCDNTTAASIKSPIRLLIVSITGSTKLDEAMRIQDSWQQFLGPQDMVRTICDVGCHNNQSGIVELDPDLAKSIKRPWHFETAENSWGYRLSQLKFYFGLISQVQQLVVDNNVPEWILIKDDDSYIHADRLMQLVEGVDFSKEKVSVVGGFSGRDAELHYPTGVEHLNAPPEGCHWPNGGTGWLVSQAMALELATIQQDRVYDFMRRKLEQSRWAPHYDIWLPEIASWGGGQLYHSPALTHLRPGEQDCFDPDTNTTSFASIHMKDFVKTHGFEGAMVRLEDCMGQRTFVLPDEPLRDRIAKNKQQNSSVQYCPRMVLQR